MKKGGNKKGGTRRGRRAASTSSPSKNDDAPTETAEATTQETLSTQETEDAAKVESPTLPEEGENKEEVKENQEKAGEQAKPGSSRARQQEKDPNDEVKGGACSSQLQAKEKKQESENQEKEDEQPKPDSSTQQEEDPNVEAEDRTSSLQPQAEEVKNVKKKRGRPRKRKRSTQKEAEKKEESSPSVTRAKRARVTTDHEAEPEYFEEKRSLEDLWKVAFPAGTEWDQLDALYEFNWDFINLEEALEEGGQLYGKKVYVFGCTESHVVTYRNENKTVLVPTVVCIESSIPPSDKIGITSVQSEVEQIVPMKDMKMAWTPYTPLEKRDRNVARMNFQIFTLGCTQRRSALKHLKEDRAKQFNYCLPYIDNPFKEDESEQSTVVQITFPSEPPVVCEYDWSKTDIEKFTNDLIVDEALLLEKKDEFQEFVEKQREKAQKAIEEARQAREEAKEGMSEKTKEAYKEMKLYKFYPLPPPDLSGIEKSSFINKYFGKAHEVV